MKKLFVLTGAGMSVESGLSTFRDADGLWENYPVARVATHEAWLEDPVYVNNFYNMLRRKLLEAKPNEAAGSSRVIHLHGELMKTCSSRDVDSPHFIRTMTPDDLDVQPGEKAGDGSLLRPYIVFFGEAVPNISVAADYARQADMFVIIGTSLNVYPAAGLVQYAAPQTPIYLIDPKPVMAAGRHDVRHIQKGASEGMRELSAILLGDE